MYKIPKYRDKMLALAGGASAADNRYIIVGLSATNPNNQATSITYGWYTHANGLTVAESGVPPAGQTYGTHGAYAPGGVLKIARENGNIVYYYNNVPKYTRIDPQPNVPMLIDFACYEYNRSIYNVRINSNFTGYAPDIVSYSDYSPYGTLLGSRHGNDDTYRYGFQGQERDDEIKGAGNSYNYEYRMHDPRIGRFFACDPLEGSYPWYTPYQFSGNKLISYKELEGLEETQVFHNTGVDNAANIIKGSYKEGASGWAYFMTNSNGRNAGSAQAAGPVQLVSTVDFTGANTMSPSDWTGFYGKAKEKLGLDKIPNGELSSAQAKSAEALRNQLVAEHMLKEGGDLWVINTGKSQKIVAAKGNILKSIEVEGLGKGWLKLFESKVWKATLIESGKLAKMAKVGIDAFAICDLVFSVYDAQINGNFSGGILPTVDFDEYWHKQLDKGLQENDFEKAYTGLAMMKKVDHLSVVWMTQENMLHFFKTAEVQGTSGNIKPQYKSQEDMGSTIYEFMAVRYKNQVLGVLSVPKKPIKLGH